MLAAEALGEVADHLIGHFVDQARRSGASWTEIGKCMGVTKQAAQKRFVPKTPTGLAARLVADQGIDVSSIAGTIVLPPPVDVVPALIPFDGRSKKALELTFRQALRLRHNYVGTEHLLLALYEEEDDDGVLHGLGLDWERFEHDLPAALDAITRNWSHIMAPRLH